MMKSQPWTVDCSILDQRLLVRQFYSGDVSLAVLVVAIYSVRVVV